jgi:methylenetetrahydrofolate dehydrogenase (NADP+) / methenyltetrahydrofolate cyclohydrolase
MRLIDGAAIAAPIRAASTAEVTRLRGLGIEPRLAIVVPTDDEATDWYTRSLVRAAERVGLGCQVDRLIDATRSGIAAQLAELSADPAVHGILLQTPLPDGVSLAEVSGDIAPGKDVDGANPASLGRLVAGRPTFAPATAAAVVEILRSEGVELAGARVVVLGRSTVVGKPAALLLLAADATVTVCHSRTADLAGLCAQADVLVAAVGRAGFVGAGFVRPGAVVIDVGTNPTADGSLVGDVDAAAVADRAAALTPVPGGVGPVTTQLLLRNVLTAAGRSWSGGPG